MKYFLKDLLKVFIILTLWYNLLNYFYKNAKWNYYESIKYFPFHLIISIGYYAVISICFKLLSIRDCNKEYTELVEEIKDGKEFLEKNGIIHAKSN